MSDSKPDSGSMPEQGPDIDKGALLTHRLSAASRKTHKCGTTAHFRRSAMSASLSERVMFLTEEVTSRDV